MTGLDYVAAIGPQQIWEGVVARVVSGDRLSMAVIELEPGAVVPEHRHANEQAGLVIDGSVTFTVAGETRDLGPGGTWLISGDTPHSVEAGSDGAVVIDVFAPPRDDWAAIKSETPEKPRWPPAAA
jgi:quercetin dioxygenase-like cupin family protein